jgi:hypothetical protein
MTRVMCGTGVKPEHVAENERYFKNVFEQLDREQPTGRSWPRSNLATA